MPLINISVSESIDAPAASLYEIISDYKVGHPSILPAQYFGKLEVLEGGRGAGTRIRFEMKAFGATRLKSVRPTRVLDSTTASISMPRAA